MGRNGMNVVGALALVLLAGCSNLSPRERDTAVGAAIGGAAGHVITGGSTMGTVGGAAIGGVIGNRRNDH